MKAAAGSRSSEAERVISSCLRWEFIRETRRRVRNPLAMSRRRRRKKRAVKRVESAETQVYVSALPLTRHLDQKMAEDEKTMGELKGERSKVKPRWVLQSAVR